jgi:hypothetical protein
MMNIFANSLFSVFLCDAEDQTQGFVHASQALYH